MPQLEKPIEQAIHPLDAASFRVPGAAPSGTNSVVEMGGGLTFENGAWCVAVTDESRKKTE
ncbi:hypothetical protein D3C77_728210 [compost metagenome]